MDIDKIREFLAVAEYKDLLEVGDALYLSPSTLSRHIKALEAEIGEPLFIRKSRSFILNENGEFFLPYATQILKAYDAYTAAVKKKNKDHQDCLYLGITPTIAQYDIEPILSDFQKTEGSIQLDITTEAQENLIESLRSHKYDFIFLRSHRRPDSEFSCIGCRKDSMAAVLPKAHPLAGRETLRLEDLRRETILLLSENKYINPMLFELCEEQGFDLKVGLTSCLENNLIDFVRRGVGIALLNQQHVLSVQDEEIAVVPIIPQITSEIYILFRGETASQGAGKAFLEHLRSFEGC